MVVRQLKGALGSGFMGLDFETKTRFFGLSPGLLFCVYLCFAVGMRIHRVRRRLSEMGLRNGGGGRGEAEKVEGSRVVTCQTDKAFEEHRKGDTTGATKGSLALVDFTASWCGPCKHFAPKFARMSADPAFEDVAFLKVDIDQCRASAKKFAVRQVPTFVLLKNGKAVGDPVVGAREAELRKRLTAALPPAEPKKDK